MKILINELLKEENKKFDINETLEGFDKDDYHVFSPIIVNGTISLSDNIFLIDLVAEYSFNTLCDRCLTSINGNEKIKIKDKLFRDDLFGIFESCLDLEEFVKNSIISEIPAKILCSENCKGLCPECGNNLNETSCNCLKEKYNPQFAELLSLLNEESKN